MRIGEPGDVRNFQVGSAALAAFRLVKFHTDGTLIYTGGLNEDAIGVTQQAGAIGARIDVAMCGGGGTTMLEVDGNATNLTYGDQIISHSATGQGQKRATTAATVYYVRGTALGTATADTTEILIELNKYTHTTPA